MATRWQAYLEQLPEGVASYPDYRGKVVFPKAFYETFGKPQLPPVGSSFVPEVHARTLYTESAGPGRCLGHTVAPPGLDSVLLSKMQSSQFEIALGSIGAKNIRTTTTMMELNGRMVVQTDTAWTE